MTNKTLSRALLAASLALATVGAHAAMDDATIRISRALNSPTITVKYDGAAAAVVEIRVNGRSLATRDVDPEAKSGETNFSLDLSKLDPGDNKVEVRLFDEAGKLIGSQSSIITIEDHTKSAVFLKTPSLGQTVRGLVKIDLGFGREMKNVYVSFFVNDRFTSMTNFPPYSFMWDTIKEKNGWHDLEAWVVDEANNTFKTRRTRVFVDNPGGRTDRVKPVDLQTGNPKVDPKTGGSETGVKPGTTGGSEAVVRTTDPKAPNTAPVTSANQVTAKTVGAASGVKPGSIGNSTPADGQLMTPTGTRVAIPVAIKPTNPPVTAPTVTVPSVKPTAVDTTPIPTAINVSASPLAGMARRTIEKGTRLPITGKFAIMLDSRFVEFDVQPRVEDGVPLTPFRHLIEHAGGSVDWDNLKKEVTAETDGRTIWFKIGDKMAKINSLPVDMEIRPYIERGRSIVPLSFIKDTLDVEVEYDPETGHVLITSAKKSK
ncbi:MAG: hypothetical protein KIS66_04915 [Fimbriimonadaceae bacterium]|nr:hypothetical protein [Fimbriimonadaceae bacterium]